MGRGVVDLEIEPDDYWAFELAGLCRLGDDKQRVAAAARAALNAWCRAVIREKLSRVTTGNADRA